MSRYVLQFSCGAASAVTCKLFIAEHPEADILIVNAFIQEEDEDNRRFLADCEVWFGRKVTILRDVKYAASTVEVWRQKRFIKGPHGAPCATELKRKLLGSISEPGDIIVFGFTTEEADRLADYREFFPDQQIIAPLVDKGVSKADCFAIITRAGLELPRLYGMGFDNGNCIGCPKGGQRYWQKVRKFFPARFTEISDLQQDIGPGSYFLRFRSGPRKGERMSLLELPPDGIDDDLVDEPDFSCSFFCQIAEQDIAGHQGMVQIERF